MNKQTCDEEFKPEDYYLVNGRGCDPCCFPRGPKCHKMECKILKVWKKKQHSSRQAEFIIERFIDEDLNKMVKIKGWNNVLYYNSTPVEYFDSRPSFYVGNLNGRIMLKSTTLDNIPLEKNKIFTENEWNEILKIIKAASKRLKSIKRKLRQKDKRTELEKEWCGTEVVKI